MNKLIIPLIIVILLLAGFFAYWIKMKPNSVVKEPMAQVTQAVQPTQTEKTTLASLKDLLTQGVSQQCTYSYTDEKMGKTDGVMLVANGKVRGSFSLTDPKGVVTAGNMINDGAFSYTWDDTTKTGMKIAMTEELKKMGEETVKDNPQVAEMNKKTDYRCKAWVVDASKFVPPTDIKFTDLSKMMENLNPSPKVSSTNDGESPTTDQCAICDSLPTEAQASCRTSMKCE